MKMLLALGLIIFGVVVILFLVSALLPAEWSVERSLIIDAPPSTIYPLIANFKTGWSQWNPWEEVSMKISFAGPDEGVRATQTWEGGDTNGGTIQIIKADPLQGIEFALRFGTFPIDGKIALRPEGISRTKVTWTDAGKIAGLPIYRFMRFMLPRYVGNPMERGLANLKQQAESH